MSSLVFCTLLGPEGPDRPPLVSAECRPLDPLVIRLLADYHGPRTSIPGELPNHDSSKEGGHETASTGKTKYRPYFENYTVDASILETSSHRGLLPR